MVRSFPFPFPGDKRGKNDPKINTGRWTISGKRDGQEAADRRQKRGFEEEEGTAGLVFFLYACRHITRRRMSLHLSCACSVQLTCRYSFVFLCVFLLCFVREEVMVEETISRQTAHLSVAYPLDLPVGCQRTRGTDFTCQIWAETGESTFTLQRAGTVRGTRRAATKGKGNEKKKRRNIKNAMRNVWLCTSRRFWPAWPLVLPTSPRPRPATANYIVFPSADGCLTVRGKG